MYIDDINAIPYHIENINKQLPVSTYKWSITECNKMKSNKKASVGQSFTSNIFKIGDLKWSMKIFPNNKEGEFEVNFEIITLPSTLSKVICNANIIFDELNRNCFFPQLIMDGPCDQYQCDTLSSFDEIEDLNTITITLELTLLAVYDKNEQIMDDYVGFPDGMI